MAQGISLCDNVCRTLGSRILGSKPPISMFSASTTCQVCLRPGVRAANEVYGETKCVRSESKPALTHQPVLVNAQARKTQSVLFRDT